MMTGETILVIDPDTDTTQKIVSTLESEDFLVFTAPNGEVGITMAKKVNPALIFVNPAMGGTSGLEVCKTLHSIETLENVPIVVISAFEGSMDPRYKSIYGIVDSLKKNFTIEELVAKTKSALSGKHLSADVPASVEEEEAIPEPEQKTPEPQRPVTMEEQISDLHQTPSSIAKGNITDKISSKMQEKTERPIKTEKTDKIDKPAKTQQIPNETEDLPNEAKTPDKKPLTEYNRPYVYGRNIRRRTMSSRLLVPVIVIVLVAALGVGGFMLYKNGLIPFLKPKPQVATTPLQQIAQPPAREVQPQESQQQAQLPDVESQPAASAPATPPIKPEAQQEAKPKTDTVAAKPIYSVQIGAFKSKANADALAKKYKDKGYDSFVHAGIKDKETIYRVLVGKSENRKEINTLASSISAKEKLKVTIFKE